MLDLTADDIDVATQVRVSKVIFAIPTDIFYYVSFGICGWIVGFVILKVFVQTCAYQKENHSRPFYFFGQPQIIFHEAFFGYDQKKVIFVKISHLKVGNVGVPAPGRSHRIKFLYFGWGYLQTFVVVSVTPTLHTPSLAGLRPSMCW